MDWSGHGMLLGSGRQPAHVEGLVWAAPGDTLDALEADRPGLPMQGGGLDGS